MDFIYLIAFLITVVVIVVLDRYIWGSLLTPTFFLSVPFTLVAIIAIIVSHLSKGIPNYYIPSLFVWMVGIIIFFIPSFFFSILSISGNQRLKLNSRPKDSLYRIICWITTLILCICLLRIKAAINETAESYGTDDFAESYAVSGVFSHLMVVLSIIMAYMIYKADKNHKMAVLFLIFITIVKFAYNVKSWIILPLFAGVYARILVGKTKLSIKLLLLPVILSILFFFISYYLTLVLSERTELSDSFLTFIFTHIGTYVLGGPLSFSLDFPSIKEHAMVDALFAPIFNIYNAIVGEEYIKSSNNLFYNIGDLNDTNVRTFMGTIYVYTQNYFIFSLVVFLISLYVHLLYFIYKKVSNGLFILIANCFHFAFLSFAFFDFYWLLLGCYEIPILCLVIDRINKLIPARK